MDNRQDEVRIKAFGKNLRRIREAKGLSLQGLANESNVDKSTIERIEKALVDTRMTTISKLAAALGVDPGELFRTLS
jgi:transcriptional regulator with XRE-family HTH domain